MNYKCLIDHLIECYCGFRYNLFSKQTSANVLGPILADILMDKMGKLILKSNLSNSHILFWYNYRFICILIEMIHMYLN